VFVVGYLGDWRRAAAVLFERESLRGDSAPRREKGQKVAPTISARPTGGGGLGTDFDLDGGLTIARPLLAKAQDRWDETKETYVTAAMVARCLNAKGGAGRIDGESETFVTHSLRGDGFDASEDGTGRGTPITIYGGSKRADRPDGGFYVRTDEATSKTLDAATGLNPTCSQGGTAVMQAMQVRRLTARKCERLQGFPDDYTLIPYRNGMAADGPRYKALGNSMAVPVMSWIGRRIAMVDQIERLAA
jgi:DNA (cytosine-5)-methyltransferase 1